MAHRRRATRSTVNRKLIDVRTACIEKVLQSVDNPVARLSGISGLCPSSCCTMKSVKNVDKVCEISS